jgi:hypothetical protein
MLYLLAVLALVAAAALLVRRVNRHCIEPSNTNSVNSLPPAGYRPLFEPTEDELREYRQEQLDSEAAREHELAEQARASREADMRRLLVAWRTSPNRSDTISLLEMGADMGDPDTFAEVSEEIIRVFNENGIGGLSPAELAALIDSHWRLLPQAERSSGALFWLKEETARLRS